MVNFSYMELTKKKESLVQNITYMALMAAINVIFVLLTTYVPFLFFLIVFILPLTSTIVTLLCKKKYFPIYAFTTVGLCLLVTLSQIGNTIFYVIPSLISGFIFGLFIEKKIPSFWTLLAAISAQILFTYLSIPLINLITGTDIVTVFATVFKLQDFEYLDYVVPCFIFFLALAQEVLTLVIIKDQLTKFGYEFSDPKQLPLSLVGLLASFILFAVIFAFIYGPLAYLFSLYGSVLAIYTLVYLILEKKVLLYVCLGVGFIISMFLFAFLYQYVAKPNELVLLYIFFASITIIDFIFNYCFKSKAENIK